MVWGQINSVELKEIAAKDKQDKNTVAFIYTLVQKGFFIICCQNVKMEKKFVPVSVCVCVSFDLLPSL